MVDIPNCFSLLCLPNVYQKKRESAGKRGFPAFPFSGCLPDVYQGYFFFGKAPFLFTLSGFPLPFLLCKGRYTPLGRLLGENSPVLNEKSAKIQAFSPNNDRCKIMALYSKQVGGRPLNVAMERSTGPLLTVGTGRGSSPACFESGPKGGQTRYGPKGCTGLRAEKI